jgi:phosphomannomutase
MDFKLEEIEEIEREYAKIIKLPHLTEEEKYLIDPIVAPTSGLRIQILDVKERNGVKQYLLPKRKLFLFLRVFKAISTKYKELKKGTNLKVLIVTDDRPTKDVLLTYCSQIFAYDSYQIYYQKEEPGKSRMSSPYGAASVALLEEIKLTIVLTASHNDLTWNGVKFYIDYPIPMSGDMFKEISKIALDLKEINLKATFQTELIDIEQMNNNYVIQLLSKVLTLEGIKERNIVIWPYLGKARGIVNLFRELGANVIVIDEEIDPPNPIKEIREDKLKSVMESNNSTIALLLDADRDRIALYVKENGKYQFYIPNEIYSAMHNILAKEYKKKIINVRTIPSDLRADDSSYINILTGVGYKHLGIILYFLLDIPVDQSKVDTAILYFEDENNTLIKIKEPQPLKEEFFKLMRRDDLKEDQFLIVMWEESGGHTLNILNAGLDQTDHDVKFTTTFPLIADKYPVPALVLVTELVSRGHVISESIDWSIKGINRTIPAIDEEKVKIMKNFEVNDKKAIIINGKEYNINALSDNNNIIDIFQLKSKNSTLYFRPSGTGPEVRFYVFGKKETHLSEIEAVENYVKTNYS